MIHTGSDNIWQTWFFHLRFDSFRPQIIQPKAYTGIDFLWLFDTKDLQVFDIDPV